MFIKAKPFTGPPGSVTSFEVRSTRGRKPFATRPEADAFAKAQRAEKDGWAEVSQVVKIIVDPRS